jgi:Fe-S-cluster containining protein
VVAGCGTDKRLLNEVAEIYDWLDVQARRNRDLAGACEGCGKCCDFAGFDHRLFVTPPELTYLAANLGASIKPMPTSRCPYNIDGKCSVYEYRFAGCRIFCCNGDADFQSGLSESALEKLKSICAEFQIPYRYTNLAAALNNPAGA